MADTPDDGGGGAAGYCNPPDVVNLVAKWVGSDCLLTWDEVRYARAARVIDYKVTINGVVRFVSDARLLYTASMNKAQVVAGTLEPHLVVSVRARNRYYNTLSVLAAAVDTTKPGGSGSGNLTLGWYLDGAISSGDAQGPVLCLDRDVSLVGVTMTAKTAPSTAATVVDIEHSSSAGGGWASIFSTQPQIGIGESSGGGAAELSVGSLDANEYLRCNVDAGGAANGITIQLRMSA